jgi:hypothetical protein
MDFAEGPPQAQIVIPRGIRASVAHLPCECKATATRGGAVPFIFAEAKVELGAVSTDLHLFFPAKRSRGFGSPTSLPQTATMLDQKFS